MTEYTLTHNEYDLHGSDIISGLKLEFGDTNPYQKFKYRPWFTQAGRTYIRKDLDSPACLTFLLLRKQS